MTSWLDWLLGTRKYQEKLGRIFPGRLCDKARKPRLNTRFQFHLPLFNISFFFFLFFWVANHYSILSRLDWCHRDKRDKAIKELVQGGEVIWKCERKYSEIWRDGPTIYHIFRGHIKRCQKKQGEENKSSTWLWLPQKSLTLKAETRDVWIARAGYVVIQNTKGWKKQSTLERGKRMG